MFASTEVIPFYSKPIALRTLDGSAIADRAELASIR